MTMGYLKGNIRLMLTFSSSDLQMITTKISKMLLL